MYQSFIKPLYRDIKKFVLDTLFPIFCLSCGKEGVFLCDECQSTLINVNEHCLICQKPSPSGLTHPKCQTPFNADQLISIFDYHDEKVSKVLITGKYYFLPDVFKILGKLVADKIKLGYPNLLISNSYILVPIPLHKRRLRWRGFNQAQILCESIGKELNLPVSNVLIRNKPTKIQKDLKKEQRLKNIENAFALSPEILNPCLAACLSGRQGRQDKSEILNHNFILVDDVTTTGSTLKEAAKVLKRNGAKKVICLTVARD